MFRAGVGVGLLIVGCGGGGAEAQAPTTTGASTPVHVAIGVDGSTKFDGQTVDAATLTAKSREATQARAPLVVIVDAEREVSWQIVVSTVERIRAGGATNVLLGSILASQPHSAPVPAAATESGPAKGPTPEPHAAVAAGTKWDCTFPPTSERNGREEANVLVRVHVESTGKPISVDVLEDPGNGFGAAAKACALEKAYQSPKDVNGKPLRAATFPFYIHFVMK